MMRPELEVIIQAHPLFSGIEPRYISLMSEGAWETHFAADTYVFRTGESATHFYLIRSGMVALEIHAPSEGALKIDTIEAGGVLGWSWLFSPYRWHFDARAVITTHAIALDGSFLRVQAQKDHHFGYELMKRFTQILIERLQATRLQLLDIYQPQREGLR
ncbi:cyclic nucleotide-binding domain-containing protein [Ktedonospora formicarum]|uniref:Cyclic nucleotide-binding domain-containing protein n=1 Tax=Ktedonospora formicarum TaxID=2778364 RepID=A0A8J3I297_9CHLR|nr:cyclic nucleotide-binding domain-containing protein [Ktedonospora formicarum]GHO48722.1 hypothetical protein KSX_68850 [Ktedonospora formicarum]